MDSIQREETRMKKLIRRTERRFAKASAQEATPVIRWFGLSDGELYYSFGESLTDWDLTAGLLTGSKREANP